MTTHATESNNTTTFYKQAKGESQAWSLDDSHAYSAKKKNMILEAIF